MAAICLGLNVLRCYVTLSYLEVRTNDSSNINMLRLSAYLYIGEAGRHWLR